MRSVGLEVHRVVAQAAMLDDSRAVRLGPSGMTGPQLAAFASKLERDDRVVVEAAGNAAARLKTDTIPTPGSPLAGDLGPLPLLARPYASGQG